MVELVKNKKSIDEETMKKLFEECKLLFEE